MGDGANSRQDGPRQRSTLSDTLRHLALQPQPVLRNLRLGLFLLSHPVWRANALRLRRSAPCASSTGVLPSFIIIRTNIHRPSDFQCWWRLLQRIRRTDPRARWQHLWNSRSRDAAANRFRISRSAAVSRTQAALDFFRPSTNSSRSALIWSAWVVGIPCGKPGYVFSLAPFTSFADCSAAAAMGTI